MGRRPTSITEEYGEVDSRQTLWVKAPHVTDAAQHPLPIPALVNGSIPPRHTLHWCANSSAHVTAPQLFLR